MAPAPAGRPRARSSPTGIPFGWPIPPGCSPGSRLLDGPPHHITPAEVVKIAQDYEFVVLFTSTVGFYSDLRMARAMKEQKPGIKIAFVGPQVQIKPAESLLASPDIDFVVRGEFDHAVVEYAQGQAAFRNSERQLCEGRQSRPQSVARRCCRPRSSTRFRSPPTSTSTI